MTPLHYAAMKNSKEMGKVLISKGADINAKDIIYQNITTRIKRHFIMQQRIIQKI